MAVRGVRLAYYTPYTLSLYTLQYEIRERKKLQNGTRLFRGQGNTSLLCTDHQVLRERPGTDFANQAIEEKCGGKTDEIERVAWARYHVPKSRHWALIGRQFLISQLCVHHGDSQRTD